MTIGDRKDEFAQYCSELSAQLRVGRQSLLRDWSKLTSLFEQEVLPRMKPEEIQHLLGKPANRLDPEENDLKALVAHGVGRGWIAPEKLRDALHSANQSAPLFFLRERSGKAFGETVAPELCKFWLCNPGDRWDKQPSDALYDIAWQPPRMARLRIEVKASAESPGFRFQQIRKPDAGLSTGGDYDAMLCLGVTGNSLDFWLIPSDVVSECIQTKVFVPQHGGQKKGLESNTYWVTMTGKKRHHLRDHYVAPNALRDRAISLIK